MFINTDDIKFIILLILWIYKTNKYKFIGHLFSCFYIIQCYINTTIYTLIKHFMVIIKR